ncbi:haloacid dehalogenase [Coniochaeta ligniaria NRRL 30616]|uniref:Haloacid dehalogenase n=1 Tax=Coniochaeta ligniaria NRRL 30616 TaxID=1408157 RepID=A0A1J7IGP1_9PEZI|nr:haloacid dehalogenase [Coniochaeta ligniaria NRRL 30616]
MTANKTVIAFDLYGTLLSTDSIAKELAKLFGQDKAQSLAALWRRYQLEYTWRINSMGLYRTFSEVTKGALEHAVAETGLSLSVDDAEKLMKAYDSLHVFPEIPAALDVIKENSQVDAYIFSNGTQEMVAASVQSSPDLVPYADLFKGFITVHEVQVFKPAMKVYDDLITRAGKDGKGSDVWVVTANPFDAVGASVAGLRSAWIDRAGRGWVDRLGDVIGGIRPNVVVSGVDEAVGEIMKLAT